MNYDDFLSRQARLSRTAPIRVYTEMAMQATTPIINMSGGLPNDEMSPLVAGEFTLGDGTTIELSGDEMRIAQQYNLSEGNAALREWLTELVVHEHHPPTYGDTNPDKAMRLLITSGAQQGIFCAAQVLINRGDKVIVPEFYFTGFYDILRRLEVEQISIKSEDDGPDMDQMEGILSQWNPADAKKWADRPKVLYTIPNGCNPSGETISLEKRRKIYSLAQKYNFIIIEDDAYYYMQYSQPKIPSFFSMDVDGRVIRCDTFSKVVGAGYRVGWVTGPHALVTRMLYEVQLTTQHASVLSQVVINKLVRKWGMEGFLERAERAKNFYRRRRDIIVKAAETHLTGLATWSTPLAGMFLWIKLKDIDDSEKFILSFAMKNRFLVIPGGIFSTYQTGPSPYIRVSYSIGQDLDLEKGIERLADAIREALERGNNHTKTELNKA